MKTNQNFYKWLFRSLMVTLFFNFYNANAQDTWTGLSVTSGAWNDGTNWSTLSAPTSSDNAIIPSSYSGSFTPVLTGTDDVKALTISTGQTVTVTAGYSLTISGSLTGGGILDLSAASGTVSVAGDITIDSINPGTANNIVLNGATNQNIGAGTFDNLQANNEATLTGNIVVNGNLTGTGSLDGSSQTIIIKGNMTVSTFTYNTSLVILHGKHPQNIGPYTFYNLEADNDSIVLSNSEIVEGNLTGNDTLDGVSGGSLTVYGDFAVKSYLASTSTVYLIGSSNQNLSWPYTFYNLTLDNSAGAALAGGDLTIANNLTLTSGIVSLGTNNLIITPTTGGLTGTFNSSNYIKTNSTGILRMSAGSGGIIYPIGDDYNPITITDAGAHVFDVGVSDAVTDGNNNPVTDWSVNRTWTVTSLSAASITVGTQWVEPADLASGGHFDNIDAFIAYRDVTHTFTWTPMNSSDISAQNPGPYTLTSPSTISILADSLYNIGVGLGTASPLPVSLFSFTAQYQDNLVNLNWATASEQNNAYFEVQRSADAANWVSIGKVQGHGTTDVYNSYVDIDNLESVIPSGTLYYRLKQVDFNGNFTYSMIRSVDINSPSSVTVSAYPNPANSVLYLNWTSNSDDNIVLKLMNEAGVNVYEQTVSGKGIVQKKIDISSLPAGLYFVQLIGGSDIWVANQSIVKE